MKTISFISSLLLLSCISFAQPNLVLNSSFEKGDALSPGTYSTRKGGYLTNHWMSPLKKSPKLYYAPRKSVPTASEGFKAIGLTVGSGKQEKTKFEYITGKLSEPLKKGEVYCISFKTLLQRSSKWAATDFGLLLHHDLNLIADVPDPKQLSASLYANGGNPVLNTKWRQYSGYYLASGGEEYISFGKFGNSESVQLKNLGIEPYSEMDGFQGEAYYHLDEISVVQLSDSSDCGCADNIPDPETPETANEPDYQPFLFALDASSSMRKNDLYDRLRNSLKDLLQLLPKGTPVSMVTFSSTARPIFMGKVDASTPFLVDSILSRRGLSGGTNVYSGLKLAYEGWETDVPDSARMVLISDGAFTVTKKIEEVVKEQYENYGRKLTVVQIDAKAKGMEKLEPYQVQYINTTPSEIGQVFSQLYQNEGKGEPAVPCDCVEEYSDTLNYHFVIDYSGSMIDEKWRATSAVKYLFNEAPDNAMISVTVFNKQAEELYVGKKSDITIEELSAMLRQERARGGTDPEPGVKHALRLAYKLSKDRYSHLILVTDLTASNLSRRDEMTSSIKNSVAGFDLSCFTITIDQYGFVATYSEFDETTSRFVNTSKSKFETDLFDLKRSSCDYSSQPYHYNPAKSALKAGTKRFFGRALQSILKSAAS